MVPRLLHTAAWRIFTSPGAGIRRQGVTHIASTLNLSQQRASYATKKSPYCVGSISGQLLTEYSSRTEALTGAAFANAQHGNALEPYHCTSCGMWHLSPRSRATPSMPCACTTASGKPKALFLSLADALRRSEIVRQEQGTVTEAYRCELGLGWHLTKGRAAENVPTAAAQRSFSRNRRQK